KEFIVEFENDLFAQPAKPDHFPAVDGGDRRIYRTNDEWTRQTHAFKRLVQDAWLECLDIEKDVRQFGHRQQLRDGSKDSMFSTLVTVKLGQTGTENGNLWQPGCHGFSVDFGLYSSSTSMKLRTPPRV